MKTKNDLRIVMLLSAITFIMMTSCKDKKTEEPINFSARVSGASAASGASVTFTDESTGVSSRKWTFPGGTPATSTDAAVTVKFLDGPVTANLSVVFRDNSVKTKDFNVQVGTEMYSRAIFGFEGENALTIGKGWKVWNANSDNGVQAVVDNTQGANGTSRCLKVTLTKNLTNEGQLFTKENKEVINAVLEPNKAYAFSFYIKADQGIITSTDSESSYLNADIQNQNDVKWGNNLAAQDWKNFKWVNVKGIKTSWTKMTFEFTTDNLYSGSNALNAFAYFKFSGGLPAGVVYIDEVSLMPK